MNFAREIAPLAWDMMPAKSCDINCVLTRHYKYLISFKPAEDCCIIKQVYHCRHLMVGYETSQAHHQIIITPATAWVDSPQCNTTALAE